MAAKKSKKAKAKKRGRPEEPLILEGPWGDAVAKSFRKPPPQLKPTGRKRA